MTSFLEIQSAIVSKLSKIAPEVDVNSSDVEEGFKRPSFFIDMLDVDVENLMDKFQERELEFDIIYFPKHPKKNQIDLLEMREILTKAFVEEKYFNITDDLVVEATEVKIIEIDKVLHCEFKIFISEEYLREYEYNMEDLEFKEGINVD
ncbi:MAG: phage tail terminator family protein [Cetobacterium sp.]|uniref:phage tail terminator family protein n=1 Tax=Cetobacterium sp. TaxID=2071632 RepID=UPI003F3BC019